MAGMWSAILPVKHLSMAKTRLRGAVADVTHRDLVLAVTLDTIAAVLACPLVGRVLVVTDEPLVRGAARALGARPVPDEPGRGLNAAFAHGAALAADSASGAVRVVALTADLPALRPSELAAALDIAADAPRAFLADAEGTGTTMLTAAGVELNPRFGTGSAAAHAASGAVALSGDWPSLRRDVDTAANLAAAEELGLGPRTALMLAKRSA
jgi:2-phospho-L-lactate/phosphoenolpyruvate guanylyltransferase